MDTLHSETIFTENIAKGQSKEGFKTAVRTIIQEGILAPHDYVPPFRKTAGLLEMGVTTTRKAYLDLQAEGYLETRGKTGTLVSPMAPCFRQRINTFTLRGPINLRPANETTYPDTISPYSTYGEEKLHPSLFNRGHFDAQVKEQAAGFKHKRVKTIYTLYEDATLYAQLRSHINDSRQFKMEAENFALCYHLPPTLEMLAGLFAGPGEVILSTETFMEPWNMALRATGANLIGLDAADETQLLACLAKELPQPEVKLLLINSRCSSYRSTTYSDHALDVLLEACIAHGVQILEVDLMHEFWYPKGPFRLLANRDHQGQVIYCSPFSLLDDYMQDMCQIAAASPVIEALHGHPKRYYMRDNLVKEQAISHMLSKNQWNGVRNHAREGALKNRDNLLFLLRNHLDSVLECPEPKAGLSICASLKGGMPAACLVRDMQQQGVPVNLHPRQPSFSGQSPYMRIGFGSFNLEESNEHVKQIERYMRGKGYFN